MESDTDILFALLRGALEGRKIVLSSPVETSRWWHMFRLAQQNHVTAMMTEALPEEMPREVLMPWIAEQQKAEEWYQYQHGIQEEIVGTMAEHGIKTLVLKGTHIAQYYPVPVTREFGDLDLYFYDKHDEADRVARKELKVEVSNDVHHHSKYDYRGVTVESHYDFLNVHYPPSNRHYEALLKELTPSPTFEVLFLLRHMAGHFAASRITLRDIVDWALSCRALTDKADWQLIEKTISEYGMTDFAAAICQIAENRLGVRTPLGFSNINNCRRIERDIIYGDKATTDKGVDGVARLIWKLRRWRVLEWKRKMVYNDSPVSLMLSSLTAHTMKPQSILHKQ